MQHSALERAKALQDLIGAEAEQSERAGRLSERVARAMLDAMGVAITPQDGSGLEGDCAALIVSTAVEEEVPAAGGGAKARNVAGIGRNFRVHQNNLEGRRGPVNIKFRFPHVGMFHGDRISASRVTGNESFDRRGRCLS